MKEQLPKIPIIESKRLILRPVKITDAEDLFAYAKKPEMAQFVFWKPHQSINESKQFINDLLNSYETENKQMWAIELKSNQKMIGTCGFMHYYPINKMLEIGYALSQDFWRQGYTKEALQALIDYAFTKLDIIRIEGICVVDNTASAKTMESCQMQFEGIIHDGFIKDHTILDCKLYAITKRQYLKK